VDPMLITGNSNNNPIFVILNMSRAKPASLLTLKMPGFHRAGDREKFYSLSVKMSRTSAWLLFLHCCSFDNHDLFI